MTERSQPCELEKRGSQITLAVFTGGDEGAVGDDRALAALQGG